MKRMFGEKKDKKTKAKEPDRQEQAPKEIPLQLAKEPPKDERPMLGDDKKPQELPKQKANVPPETAVPEEPGSTSPDTAEQAGTAPDAPHEPYPPRRPEPASEGGDELLNQNPVPSLISEEHAAEQLDGPWPGTFENQMTIDDCNLVTTQDILTSSNVQPAPPSVNQAIPVPSVYQDERGEIHNLSVGGFRINLLYTKQGVMRSGDIHKSTQHDFIVKGRVEVWRMTKQGTQKTVHQSFEYIRISPFVPHIFHFLDDTVMAEWWEPQGVYAWFYEPYRKLVEESFQRSRPGSLRILKPQADQEKNTSTNTLIRGTIGVGFTGLVVGVALGYFLGRQRGQK